MSSTGLLPFLLYLVAYLVVYVKGLRTRTRIFLNVARGGWVMACSASAVRFGYPQWHWKVALFPESKAFVSQINECFPLPSIPTCRVFELLSSLNKYKMPPCYASLVALHSKYKLMETNLDKVKQNMKEKVPEIERSLELVRHLQERQVI